MGSGAHRLQELRLLGSEAQDQQLWHMGLAALRHVGSSQIRDWTHVSCIATQSLPLSHQGSPIHFFNYDKIHSLNWTIRKIYCLSFCRDAFIKLCSGLMALKLKVVRSCYIWLAVAITATGYSWVQYSLYCTVSSWTGTAWNTALRSLCLKNLGTFWRTVTLAFIWYYRQSNTCKQSYFPLAQEKQITNSVANVQNSVICIWCLCWIICCQHINLIFGFIFLNLPCLDFFSFAFNPFELNCKYLCQLLEIHFGKNE